MKRGITIILLLFLLVSPLVLAEETTTIEEENALEKIDIKQFAKDNPWNGTIIISPVWQTLIGGFFGLNLQNESTEISVTETIVFIMVFIMFFVIILDIIKMTPFLKNKILEGFTAEPLVALIITTIVSITGAFISLKNLFISGIAYTVTAFNWTWLNNAIASKGWGTFMVAAVIIIIIIAIHEGLSWIQPIIKKLSQVSRAEAKGRMLKRKIEEAGKEDIEEPGL